MRICFSIIIVLFAALFLSDCKKDKALANYGGYPNEVGKIMVLKCATEGCHNSASYLASASLDLSTWDALFRGSSTGSSVIPFRSDFSSLCYFINTYPELGYINYPTMPYNRSVLSKDEVQTIKNWINDGAPDLNGNVKWADNPNRRKIYITNQGCDVVTVIDAETQLPMRYITVGKDPNTIEVPHQIKVSPDGQYWYVVFVNANILQKFRCSDDALVGEAYLGLYYDWNTVAISDDGTRGYCVSWVSNGRVASVDLTQMKTINNYGGYFFPHGIALNHMNDTLYVTGQTGNYIMKIDTSLATTQTISLQNSLPPSSASSLDPHEILLSKDYQNLYITCQTSNEVRVYNIPSNSVTNIIPVGTSPVEMAMSSVQNKLYVTCTDDVTSFPGFHGSVSEILLGGAYPERRIQVGAVPHGIAVDDNAGLVYVSSRNILSSGPAPHHSSVCAGRNGYVNLIDISTFTVKTKHSELSVDPYGTAIRK
jgi:YVTN family beta-propeller protein